MVKETTKLSSEIAKRLKALGITAKTEEDARTKILEVLEENGCDGFDDSPFTELCDILESIILADAAPEQTEEEEVEQMAEEETEEETEETSEEETEEEEAEETEEGINLDNMSRKELIQFIKDNSLPIKVLKSMSDEDIRNAICDFISEEPEEEETEEEAPAPTPKKEEKKPSKKEKKAEPEKPAKSAKAKPEKKEEKKSASAKKSAKLDPKNNEDDRKELLNALTPYFPEDKFEYAWVVSAGVTIKHKGSNGRRGIMLLENCTRQADGSITCNAYLLTFAKKTDLLEQNDIEYSVCWNGNPFFKHITLEDLCGFIDEWKDEMLSFVEKVDKKLGENRKKMEENLEKKSAPAKKTDAKTPAKKVVIPKKTVKKK